MKPVQQYDSGIILAVKTLQVKLVYLYENLIVTACMALQQAAAMHSDTELRELGVWPIRIVGCFLAAGGWRDCGYHFAAFCLPV